MNLKSVVKTKEPPVSSSGGETTQSDTGDNSKKRKQNSFLVEVQERAEVSNILYIKFLNNNECKLCPSGDPVNNFVPRAFFVPQYRETPRQGCQFFWDGIFENVVSL